MPRAFSATLTLAACLVACTQDPFGKLEHPAAAVTGWTYEVAVSPRLAELVIEASFAPRTSSDLTVGTGGEPFVRDVEVLLGEQWRPVRADGDSWPVASCSSGCRLRYRFELKAVSGDSGPVTEIEPSKWLFRPRHALIGTPFHLHVTTPPGTAFVTGLFPVAGSQGTYAAETSDIFQLPYSALGALKVVSVDDGHVQVAMPERAFKREPDVVAWVDAAARAIEGFYGRFPVPRALVLIHATAGRGVSEGRTVGAGGASIAVDVGVDSTRDDLSDDWVLVHEMVHTSVPDLATEHHWLEEGLATYVEPLARVRAGLETPDEPWHGWIAGMPNGLPASGDLGLDRTHTWGRTYWGGALFCLLADLEIRSRTSGAKALDDALRGVLTAGGNISKGWTIDQLVDAGDGATGTRVLRELYDRHATSAVQVDLDAIWQRLGVRWDGKRIVYDDSAPLALVRKGMTRTNGS